MRPEIKFRAWDTYNKVWIGPYTLKQLADDDQFNYDTEVHPISSKYDSYEWVQYTGLHDRAGKEVYKGDIVKATVDTGELTSVTETVFYHEKYAAFYPFCRLISYADGRWIDCLFDGFEVIGNIYEHPELMRKA